MSTTSVGSRYTPGELAELDRARGGKLRSVYQHDATMQKVRSAPGIETWADHMGVNAGPIPTIAALDKIVSLGLRWVSISPERGWGTDIGTLVNLCHDKGLKVHGVAQESGHAYESVVANPLLFSQYALSFCTAGVDALTIGCEWNNPPFWRSPDSKMTGAGIITANCLNLIRQTHQTPVYTVGWSPNSGALAPAAAQRELCNRLLERGVTPSRFAGSSLHPYCYNGPLAWGIPQQHREWNAFLQIPDVYVAAKEQGLVGGMSLGEYGCPSAGTQSGWPFQQFSEAWQAQMLREYFEGFENYRRFGVPIAFIGLSTAIDGDAVSTPIEGSMGVFRKDGSEKEGASVVRIQAKKVWVF